MPPHRIFYHADLSGRLTENQPLELSDGLSVFGLGYQHVIGQDHVFLDGHYRREIMLERIRTHNPNVSGCNLPSRLTSVFACLSIEDAKMFAHKSTEGKTTQTVNIFEIIARPRSFHFRDMGWLDLPDAPDTASNYVSYWLGRLMLADHDNPFIEVCIDLPARVGRIVETFTISQDYSWKAPIWSATIAP